MSLVKITTTVFQWTSRGHLYVVNIVIMTRASVSSEYCRKWVTEVWIVPPPSAPYAFYLSLMKVDRSVVSSSSQALFCGSTYRVAPRLIVFVGAGKNECIYLGCLVCFHELRLCPFTKILNLVATS